MANSETEKSKILNETYPLLLKVMSCNTDGIWEWDIEGDKVTWALPIHEVFRIPQTVFLDFEFVQKKLIHPLDRTKHLKAVQQCIKTGDFSVEVRCVRGDGQMIWIESTGSCLYNEEGLPIKMMGTITDITDKKKAEEEVWHLGLAVENAMTGISWLDKDGYYRVVRAGYANLLGYSVEELVNGTWEKTVHKSDLDKVNAAFAEMLETGKAETEILGVKKDGSLFYKQLLLVKTFDSEEKHNGHYCFMRDINERKGFEQEIKKQNDELKQINSELDNFVYRVSHDLRAPLSSALGLVELCQQMNTQKDLSSYLQLQEKSLVKLDSFIKDILDYSRNSRKELTFVEVDLAMMIDEVLMLNEEYKKQITRKVSIELSCPLITDEMRVRVFLNNLISNAFKFSFNRKTCASYVKIEVSVNEEQATIQVADNGIGIATEHQTKIFDMFYRATDYKPGSGIGLYIANESVKKLGGTIQVESELGKGTCFTVVIPNRISR